MHKILNVNDYFQVAMRSGKMHSECGGPAIVDDTISTGGALVALINAVRQAGGHVTEVICVVEKVGNNGVRKVYDETGITVRSILKIHVSENGVDVHDE
jgi:adenine phosphoribosyltransferase